MAFDDDLSDDEKEMLRRVEIDLPDAETPDDLIPQAPQAQEPGDVRLPSDLRKFQEDIERQSPTFDPDRFSLAADEEDEDEPEKVGRGSGTVEERLDRVERDIGTILDLAKEMVSVMRG